MPLRPRSSCTHCSLGFYEQFTRFSSVWEKTKAAHVAAKGGKRLQMLLFKYLFEVYSQAFNYSAPDETHLQTHPHKQTRIRFINRATDTNTSADMAAPLQGWFYFERNSRESIRPHNLCQSPDQWNRGAGGVWALNRAVSISLRLSVSGDDSQAEAAAAAASPNCPEDEKVTAEGRKETDLVLDSGSRSMVETER